MENKDVKLSWFRDDMIMYVKNPKESAKDSYNQYINLTKLKDEEPNKEIYHGQASKHSTLLRCQFTPGL